MSVFIPFMHVRTCGPYIVSWTIAASHCLDQYSLKLLIIRVHSTVGLFDCSSQFFLFLSLPFLLQTQRGVLKGAGSDSDTLSPIESRVHAEHSSDEEMDEGLMRRVRQTVNQALVELEEPGMDGSITETVVTAAAMQSSGTVVQEMSNASGPSHHPKAHSTPNKEDVQTTALLNCSDSEGDLSILVRRPLYPLQQEDNNDGDVGTDGGDASAPAAEEQAPVWMNLHVFELFFLVLVGLCLTIFFWYALQHYKME